MVINALRAGWLMNEARITPTLKKGCLTQNKHTTETVEAQKHFSVCKEEKKDEENGMFESS